MLAAGEHLLQMINKISGFVRNRDTGAIAPICAEFDLHKVASTCCDVIRPACLTKSISIELSIKPNVPRWIIADRIKLQQILLNLVGNAAKFTTRGSVKMCLMTLVGIESALARTLRVEIADTGLEVPHEQRQRLFKDFEQLDAAVVGNIEGAGLGLALSARLAAVMGGHIGHDDNPAGGSVFWLEIPFASGSTTSFAKPSPTTSLADQPTPNQPLHVLIVDDADINREIARSFLSSVGHKATCVGGGLEAVAAAASVDFDVILMDIFMPEMNGFEAAHGRFACLLAGAVEFQL